MQTNRFWHSMNVHWRPNVAIAILSATGIGAGMLYVGHYDQLDAVALGILVLARDIVQR